MISIFLNFFLQKSLKITKNENFQNGPNMTFYGSNYLIVSTKNSKSPGKSGKSGPDQILTNTIKNPLSIEIFYERF